MQFCIFPFLFVQQEQNRLYPTSIIAVITNNTEIRCGRSSISAMPTPVQNRTSPITFFTSGTPSRTSASARLLSQSMLPVPFLCRFIPVLFFFSHMIDNILSFRVYRLRLAGKAIDQIRHHIENLRYRILILDINQARNSVLN